MDERALKDGSVWEKIGLLIQVNESDGMYLVVAFSDDGGLLTYSGSVIFNEEDSLRKHLAKHGMSPTDKVITLCRKEQ